MKAIFVPEGELYSIELIAESLEDRKDLIECWDKRSMKVGCKEWREMSGDVNGGAQ